MNKSNYYFFQRIILFIEKDISSSLTSILITDIQIFFKNIVMYYGPMKKPDALEFHINAKLEWCDRFSDRWLY